MYNVNFFGGFLVAAGVYAALWWGCGVEGMRGRGRKMRGREGGGGVDEESSSVEEKRPHFTAAEKNKREEEEMRKEI